MLAEAIISSAGLARPTRVFSGTAHRGDIFEPGCFRRNFLQLFAITKLPRPARALKTIKLVAAGHGAVAAFPVAIKRSNVADKRRDAGDGGNQEVVGAAAAQVERETALSDSAAQKSVAYAESVEIRREPAVGNEFKKKFEKLFIRGGNDRVGALDALAVAFESESGVLAGTEFERDAGIEAQEPQVRGKIATFENASMKMLISSGRGHVHPSTRAQSYLTTKAKRAERRSAAWKTTMEIEPAKK